MSSSQYLEVGYVARAHGILGEVAIKTFDPDSTALMEVSRALLRLRSGDEREVSLEHVRRAKAELLVTLEGVSRREDAEALRGATVFVPRAALPPPEDGEYFQGDLIGLTAIDDAGTTLGSVEEIWNTGEVPNLVIRHDGKDELIVPFVDEFVGEVDLERRTVRIHPPEYVEVEP